MYIRVTKEFTFEMAHALFGHDGSCRNIHGHSYRLSVTVMGRPTLNPFDPKNGMVIDFGDLKKIINKEIMEIFDHALLLNENTPHKTSIAPNAGFTNVMLMPYQPTSENLLADFSIRIKKQLPQGIKLYSLKLGETPSSYAEWYSVDNPETDEQQTH